MFNRFSGNSVRNYHSYITENPTLHNIGLASYTRNTLANFGMERKNGQKTLSRDINEYFDNQYNTIKPQLLGDSVTLSILRFEKETKRYFLTTSDGAGERNLWYTPSGNAATSLQNFQERFDLWQKGFITDNDEKYKLNYVWSNIQNSLSGCITFDVDYTVLSCATTSLVRLYFQSGGKASTERTIATAAGGMIAGVPSRATGASYAYTPTQNAGIGVYSGTENGGADNPENTVAAPMRMTYDPATNRWESGTQQMLFRLLTPIDGVAIPDLPNDVDATDLSEFYDGPLSSTFNIGSGMPVSIENGNPHLFGPNSNGCGPSPKEKVVMVNRTPRSYAKGELVIGSLINGEWIPIGLVPGTTVSKKFNIEWSNIQKYIVNASAYFRDVSDNNDITPERYMDSVRFRFYDSITGLFNASALGACGNSLQKIKILNLLNLDIDSYTINNNGELSKINSRGELEPIQNITTADVPNYFINLNTTPGITGYWQFYDADVIKPNLCGNNPDSRLKYTNISQAPKSYPETNDVDPLSVTSSWGMYFPDGYTSASVSKLKNASEGFSFWTREFGPTFVYNGNSQIDFSAEANITLNLSVAGAAIDIVGNKFDVTDNNLYHLPAQIALNSSGNQTIISELWWRAQTYPGNYANNALSYLIDPYKGDFVVNANNKDIFNLKPINATKVQFTPLSLQLALCSTTVVPNTQEATSFNEQGGYADLNLSLQSQSWDYKAFGQAWQRLSGFMGQPIDQNNILIPNGNVRGAIPFGKILRRFGTGTSFAAPRRFEKPDGGPGLLPWSDGEEISNVNGIIAAKATVSLPAGGQLELRTNNNFGLNAYGIVTGSNGQTSFISAGLFGLIPNSTGGQTKVYDNVQWGASSTDDIRAFGTTALWCKITDHSPNTIYDARYFAPLQFNPSGESMDIDVPVNPALTDGGTPTVIPVGTPINKNYVAKVQLQKINPIRRNMLLTGGGFYYIKRVIAADPSTIEILTAEGDVQTGYSDDDIITFAGKMSAKFKVTRTDANGKILEVQPAIDVINPATEKPYGLDAYGEFSSNPFSAGEPLTGNITTENGGGAIIRLNGCKIIEKIEHDTIQEYGTKLLTPSDNNGGGDDNGYVRSSKSTTYSLSTNKTGKYDIFLFFVNDIMNYPENSNGANPQMNGPFAQYVNLEISAN